jgi:hypothetical protein
MDNKTLRTVVNYDHEPSASQLWQTIGRCCRDGNVGKGIIMTRSRSGGIMFANKLCLRETILSRMAGFTSHPVKDSYCECDLSNCTCDLCKCCSACTKRCFCHNAMVVDDDDDYEMYGVLENVEEDFVLVEEEDEEMEDESFE